MPPPEKYRVAVIGRTGQGNYGHQLDTVWVNHPRAEVVAVSDPDDAGRAAAVKRLGAKAGYADYREMLDKEKPQVVSVCPRFPDCHRDMAVACFERGIHVFLEKPVARTLVEADEMVAAADRHHVKCAVAHQSRYAPRTQAVKALVAAGRIGRVLELNAHGKEDKRGGGEDLIVLGTHTFDLMRMMAGDARWCFARITVGGRKPVPADVKQAGEQIGPVLGDHIVANYGFDEQVAGRFISHVAADGAGKRWWLEIRGTKGVIHLAHGDYPAAFLCEDPSWMPGSSHAPWQPITANGVGGVEPPVPTPKPNWNRPVVDDLLAAIEQDRPPLDSLADGRAALEMIMAVYESHRLDRPVDLPLKTRKHPLTLL